MHTRHVDFLNNHVTAVIIHAEYKQLHSTQWRHVARKQTGDYLASILPKSTQLTRGYWGQPLLSNQYTVSLSYSWRLSALLIGKPGIPVGIDVETWARDVTGVYRYCLPDEITWLQQSITPIMPAIKPVILWAFKEALLKLLGMGFRVDKSITHVVGHTITDTTVQCRFPCFPLLDGWGYIDHDTQSVIAIVIPRSNPD